MKILTKKEENTNNQNDSNYSNVSKIDFSKRNNVKKVEENNEHKSNFDFLEDNNEDQRLKTKGMTALQIEGNRTKEKINLVTFINCLKFLSPIIQKTLTIEEDNLKSENIYQYSINANHFALKVLEKLNISPLQPQNRWAINSLERIYSENFLNNNLDFELENNGVIDKIIDSLIKTINNIDFENFEYEEINNDLKIELAYISSFSEFMPYFQKFNFYIPQEEENNFYKKYIDFIKNETKEWYDLKVKSNSLLNNNDKSIYYISLLKEVNKMLIETWKIEANKLVSILELKTEEEKIEWYKMHPEGYNILEIFNKCHDNMVKLFNLIGIILPNRNKF